MTQEKFKILTIIAENVLESKLIELSKSLGAKGFTLTEVRGEGSVHRQSGEMPEQKVKIEILCSADLASEILKHVSQRFFNDYSIIAYTADADVLRPSKFRK
jgi:nitrogen regulatory protein P-II 2